MIAALCGAALLCAPAVRADGKTHTGSGPITVDEAVDRALQNAPSLQARDALSAGAEATVRQSGALPNPGVEVELENFAGSGPFKDLDDSELTFALSQRIERGGKRSGRVAVAEAERDVAAIEREKTRLDVIVEARRAFYDACAAAALARIAKQTLDDAKQIEAMAARRVRSARDPATVKLRAEIQSARAKAAYDRAQVSLHTAKRKLAAMWRDPETAFDVDASALSAARDGDVRWDAASALDIQASEAAARRAASQVELEVANGTPDVSIGVGIRRFEAGGDLAGLVSLSMPLAVFDTNQGGIERAAAERRAAELAVAEAKRTVERDAQALLAETVNARAEATVIRTALLPRAEEALRTARRGYDAGAFSYLELSESMRTLTELRTREIEVLRDLHFALAALERLSGRAPVATNDQGQEP